MKIQLSVRAEREFEQASEYLIEQSPAAAHAFADVIERAFENIKQFPLGSPLTDARAGDFRQHTLTRFPYKIFYRVDAETIYVVSIFHTSQDPDKI